MDHPAAEVLARYARGELDREERRSLESHLTSCLACQGAVDGLPSRGVVRWGGNRFAVRKEPPFETAERAERLRGVLNALGGILAAAGESAAGRLLAEPEHRRRILIAKDEHYQSIGLCEVLEARCRAAWPDDPETAVELAKLSALVAQRLDRELYGGHRVEDVRALAWVHLGISFRLVSRAVGDGLAEPAEPAEQEPGAYPTGAAGAFELRDGGGRSTVVEAALREVRDAFLERRMGYDAALVTLDLAAGCLRDARGAEILPLAREAAELFEGRGVESYVVDAMRFLLDTADATDAEAGVTPDVLLRMARLLQRKRSSVAD